MNKIWISQQILDYFRSQDNPLRSLTMTRVARLLEDGMRGDYPDLQWLFHFVEKRDATLRGAKRNILSAIGKLDWNIKIRADLTPEQQAVAEQQQTVLRSHYEGIKNIKKAIKHLALAEFRGYAHLEIHTDENGVPVKFEPVPQWHFVRDGMYGRWKFVPDSLRKRNVMELPDNWIIREIEDPIDEIAVVCFVRKNMSQKDWDGFIEVYGIPYVFLIMPPTAKNSEEFQQVMDNAASDSRGVLPSGSDVKTAPVSPGSGSDAFRSHIRYQDEQIVLAATSSILTMLTESGSGTLAGGAHKETFDTIALGIAAQISETLEEQFSGRVLDAYFPGQEHFAYFEIAAKDETDAGLILDLAVKAKHAGFKTDVEEISEKTGLTLMEDTLQTANPTPSFFGRFPNFRKSPEFEEKLLNSDIASDSMLKRFCNGVLRFCNGFFKNDDNPEVNPREKNLKKLLEAYEKDIVPVRERVEAFLKKLEDGTATRDDIPDLSDLIGFDATAEILEEAMAEAVIDQMQNSEVFDNAAARSGWHDMGRFELRDPKTGKFDPDGVKLSPEENQKRGNRAIGIALRRNGDVTNAMKREELGSIDFVWGRPGTSKAGSDGRTHQDGYGISHIVAKHGEKAARKLPEVLSKGTITQSKTHSDKREVTLGTWKAIVQKKGDSKSYTVTNFDEYEKK